MSFSSRNNLAVALVLHDVAPATWPRYRPFLAEVDRLGRVPLTLLVVPDFHGQGNITSDPGFRVAMEQRLHRGDELVLHGYFHQDTSPPPRTPREYFLRRIFTHEGEFWSLSRNEALHRLERGLALFQRLGWPVRGFVAPAWLLGEESRKALLELPFEYTSDPNGLLPLPSLRPLPAPSLVWSARSAPRRFFSRFWNNHRLRRHQQAPLLRLGLHPVDMDHQEVREYWLLTLERLLQQRQPLTKSAWLERCR